MRAIGAAGPLGQDGRAPGYRCVSMRYLYFDDRACWLVTNQIDHTAWLDEQLPRKVCGWVADGAPVFADVMSDAERSESFMATRVRASVCF